VDYAAKSGTPVVAAGNGKVTESTYNKYNGNYVFIQHGNGIVTKYLHFSKRAVKKGQRVKQGQLIGTVGATGLAAGPHLHYEFLLNGVHRNPRTVKLPDAKPIAPKYKTEFIALANNRIEALTSSKNAMLSVTSTE
jgi:murein DD-endopeptidase MepM/ murein hydrolase activator NlpD